MAISNNLCFLLPFTALENLDSSNWPLENFSLMEIIINNEIIMQLGFGGPN